MTESRDMFKERKKEADFCGCLPLEEESKKGNGRCSGRGKGREMAYLWC